jgi:hypothetical protein
MKNNSLTTYLLLSIFILASSCDKDCEVVQADWKPIFLYHDGMAPDLDDNLSYVTGIENGQLFIRSTKAYTGDGSMENIYTEASTPEFVYITTDRTNNVIYWTKKNSDTIYKIERDSDNQVFLTGGPFYDLDFDDEKGLLFFAENQGSSFGIRNINPETMQIRSDAQSINGEVTFLYVDEKTQEIFWANNQFKEIWKKRITFQMDNAQKVVGNLGKIRGIAVGNFSEN